MLQIDVKTDSARLLQMMRIGRLSAGCPRLVYEDEQQMPTAYSDAKWGKQCIRQTEHQRWYLMHGKHRYIKRWSKTQSLVAVSSADFELYALARASAEQWVVNL